MHCGIYLQIGQVSMAVASPALQLTLFDSMALTPPTRHILRSGCSSVDRVLAFEGEKECEFYNKCYKNR